MWASAVMIPDTRARQPRDGPMQCGNQPADISVIHRRFKLRASRSPSGAHANPDPPLVRKIASITLASLDTNGPYQGSRSSLRWHTCQLDRCREQRARWRPQP